MVNIHDEGDYAEGGEGDANKVNMGKGKCLGPQCYECWGYGDLA